MAKPELLQSLSALSRTIDSLLEQQKKLSARVKSLEMKNSELLKTQEETGRKLEELRKENEFLVLSHRLASSPEALVAARTKISKLLRTIDSCIRMITEE